MSEWELHQTLSQSWKHSHEEDSPNRVVFRPSTHVFPPSRGRRTLNLGSDGSATVEMPGPTDRTQRSAGQWRISEDGTLTITGAGTDLSYKIISAKPDKLILERR
jgi:hypothetical protein